MNWEQEFDNKFGLNGLHAKPVEYMNYEDISEQVKAFIKQLRQQDNEELINNIENLIQKERFAGAPYALSQVQELINSYYKQ